MAGTKETDCTDFEARNTSDETVCTVTDDGVEYRLNGKLHREDGPAFVSLERSHGGTSHKEWYLNGKLHREEGPALVNTDGYKAWYINGKLHREDGPAVVDPANGIKKWYLNNVQVSEADHVRRT